MSTLVEVKVDPARATLLDNVSTRRLAYALAEKLVDDGGFTWPSPSGWGYMVSLRGDLDYPRAEISLDAIDVAPAIRSFLQANREALLAGAYVGGWLDEGVLYLDVSIHVPALPLALYLGRRWGQSAVYDLAARECVEVPA